MSTIVRLVDLFILLVREFFCDVPIWVLINVWIISPRDLFFRAIALLIFFLFIPPRVFAPPPSLSFASFVKIVVVNEMFRSFVRSLIALLRERSLLASRYCLVRLLIFPFSMESKFALIVTMLLFKCFSFTVVISVFRMFY